MNAPDPVPCTTEGPQRSAIRPSRSAMSLHAKDRHKRAARIVGYALTADDPAIWWKTAAVRRAEAKAAIRGILRAEP